MSLVEHDRLKQAASSIKNIAAYKFVPLDRLPERRKQLRILTKRLELSGTILLSTEGINLFLAGTPEEMDAFLDELRRDEAFADLEVKVSYSDSIPFRRMLVKLKREIISFEPQGITPTSAPTEKLPPRELKQWLDEGRPVTLLDVRNDYEVKLGTFRNAQAIGVSHFRHFAEQVLRLPPEWKDQPVVMFCTGGIRCEKAGPFMAQQGFQQIYQLEGGILKYFEECGDAHYDGSCFVFDQRVALDSQLHETDTALCFACQMPLTAEEQMMAEYVPGESCAYCYKTPEMTMRESIAVRHERLRELISPLPGSAPYDNRRPIQVAQKHDGVTLLELLQQLYPFVETTTWLEAITAGRLQRNNEPLAAESVVRAGDRLENVLPGTTEPDVNGAIEILYEDAALVVVNKPAPLPMHPCGRFNRNTLIYILNQLYEPQVLRVAHRLDANTTGVVVLSRSRTMAGMVQPQFERGEVEKVYLVQVQGHPVRDEFECDAPIGPIVAKLGGREIAEDGLPARTMFRVLERLADGTSRLEARPLTGRTNQIRLHAAHLGHPVCGDPLYGCELDPEATPTLSIDDPPLRLHAWQVSFRHPLEGRRVTFTAPPPDYFAAPQ